MPPIHKEQASTEESQAETATPVGLPCVVAALWRRDFAEASVELAGGPVVWRSTPTLAAVTEDLRRRTARVEDIVTHFADI